MPDRTNADAERVSDIVARLRPSFVTDLPVVHANSKCRDENTAASLSAWLVENNALKSEAADIIEAQSKALAEARAEIAETKRILEGCLAVAVKGDPLDAPFPMEPHQAVIWHQARTEAFRHALEMMPSTPTPENPNG